MARANVLREVRRCQKAIASGSPAGFWIRRLSKWAELLESSAKWQSEVVRLRTLLEEGATDAERMVMSWYTDGRDMLALANALKGWARRVREALG